MPADVERFLRDTIASAVELDVLLCLHADPARWRSAEQIGASLRIALAPAALALERLAAHNLLDVRISGTVNYRFSPVDAAAATTVDAIAARCRTARDTVVDRVDGGHHVVRRVRGHTGAPRFDVE